jgi:type I restriction enzyme S subunit
MLVDVPSGYKQTKVGVVPEDWDVVTFNDLRDTDVSHSITGGPFGSNLKSEHYTKMGVRIIQLQNIGDGLFINKDFIYTNEEKATELKSCLIYPNDIILAKMAEPVARACIIPSFENKFLMGSDGIRLHIDKKKYDNKFILESINYKQFRQIAIARSTGSTRQRIGLSDLKKIPIIIPPLKEQQKIAQILTTWDDAISKQEKLIKEKERLKKGLMQKLLSGEVRFAGFDEEWEEVKLGEVAKIIMGQSPSSNSYNEEKIGVPLIQGNADCKNRKTIPRIYTTEKTKECNIGDIIMTVRAPVGAISKSLHDACIGRGVCAIKPNDNNGYLYHFLVMYEEKWKKYSQGSTFTAVNSGDIKNLKIKLPSKQEQQKIAQVLTTSDKEIELLKKELESLKEQKKGLMQRLLSGEVRVKV